VGKGIIPEKPIQGPERGEYKRAEGRNGKKGVQLLQKKKQI